MILLLIFLGGLIGSLLYFLIICFHKRGHTCGKNFLDIINIASSVIFIPVATFAIVKC